MYYTIVFTKVSKELSCNYLTNFNKNATVINNLQKNKTKQTKQILRHNHNVQLTVFFSYTFQILYKLL